VSEGGEGVYVEVAMFVANPESQAPEPEAEEYQRYVKEGTPLASLELSVMAWLSSM
jgi:hypothetical protein